MTVEDILKEVCEENKESINPLSDRQVANILNKLLEYHVETDKIKLALEYSIKMRAEILFATSHIKQGHNPMYNYYTTIDYPVRRVLKTMGLLNEDVLNEPRYEDSVIKIMKDNLDGIEMDLKIIMNQKVKKL